MISREMQNSSQSPERSSENEPVTRLDLTELKVKEETKNVSKAEEGGWANNSLHKMETDEAAIEVHL